MICHFGILFLQRDPDDRIRNPDAGHAEKLYQSLRNLFMLEDDKQKIDYVIVYTRSLLVQVTGHLVPYF